MPGRGEVIRVIFSLINVIFVFVGLGLIAVSVWIKVDPEAWYYLRLSSYSGDIWGGMALWAAIGVGVLVLFVAEVGILGVCMMRSNIFVIYAVLLVIIVLGQGAIGAMAVLFQEQLKSHVKSEMTNQIKDQYGQTDYKALTEVWDYIQVKIKCCGSNGFNDFDGSKYRNATAMKFVPLTCCVLTNDDPKEPWPVDGAKCQASAATPDGTDEINTAGCFDELFSWAKQRSYILMALGFGSIIFQIICIGLACFLKKKTNKLGVQTGQPRRTTKPEGRLKLV